MTYPDLISNLVKDGGGVLAFLGVIIFILFIIIMFTFKYSVLPKIKEFFNSLDKLLTRIEKNETRIEKNETDLKEVKHDVDLVKKDFDNTRKLVENIAEISADHIQEMKFIVSNLEDAVKKQNETITVIKTQHEINHRRKKDE